MRSWRPRHLRKPSPGLVVNGILGVALLAAAVASYRTVAVADTATTGASASRAVPVSQGQVVSSVSASGSVQSAATAAANFVTAGTVTEIDVKVGDAVKKDQVLAKVSPTTAQEQLTAAQANLASAQQSLSQAQVTQAQNSVNSAQRAVYGTTLTAPMDGTVIAINGTVGGSSSGGSSSGSSSGGSSASNNATTGNNSTNGQTNNSNTSSSATGSTGFIQLADLGKLLVSASFAEADATKLTVGQAATVTWAALSGARTTGKITTIAPTATTQNNVNSYAVTVSLDTPPDGVRIGQTVTVSVTVAQADDAVRVPAAAVRGTGQRHTVEVVTGDGKRETRLIEVGVQGDQFVEITSGLSPGEQVALNLPTTTGTTTNRFGGGQGGLPGGGGFTGGGGNGGNR